VEAGRAEFVTPSDWDDLVQEVEGSPPEAVTVGVIVITVNGAAAPGSLPSKPEDPWNFVENVVHVVSLEAGGQSVISDGIALPDPAASVADTTTVEGEGQVVKTETVDEAKSPGSMVAMIGEPVMEP
jgi:hypothetical protein